MKDTGLILLDSPMRNQLRYACEIFHKLKKETLRMESFYPLFIYGGLVLLVTLVMLGMSSLCASCKTDSQKFLPYESGIKTETHLFQKSFPLKHYLVALLFLVFDIEVIFLYPWAVVGKEIGAFAFYEMAFFILALLVGFAYVWRKGGLQWD